ncbi:MAG: hypothetical protein IRZ08_18055 [Frankia sp.]|nr:hypothetical protein [Frankia sp.]
MPEFAFECLGIRPEPFAASPTLALRLRISETTGTPIHALALRCQVRINPTARGYRHDEHRLLGYLFAHPDRCTARSVRLATVTAMVGPFLRSTETELLVPVSYDLDVAAGRYFHAVRDGMVPLTLLFTGTAITSSLAGMRVDQLPWHLETSCRLPVATWRALMDAYFPGEAWLRLRRATVDALAHYKLDTGALTWDQAICSLLRAAGAASPPAAVEAGEPALPGGPTRAGRVPQTAGTAGDRPAGDGAAGR